MDPVSTKLAKIIPLLSSDQPGEVTAAAGALGRVLREAGHDWHWLSGKLTGGSASRDDLAAGRTILSLARERDSLKAQLSTVSRQLETLRREISTVRTDIAQRNMTIGKLRDELAALRSSESARRKDADAAPERPRVRVQPESRASVRADDSGWQFRARHLLERDAKLGVKPREFLRSLLEQDRRQLSERQRQWLGDLWSDYRKRRAIRTQSLRDYLDDEIPFEGPYKAAAG